MQKWVCLVLGENGVSSALLEKCSAFLSLSGPYPYEQTIEPGEAFQFYFYCLDGEPNQVVFHAIEQINKAPNPMPIIIVSTPQTDVSVAALFRAGANDYLLVNQLDKLQGLLENLASKSRTQKEIWVRENRLSYSLMFSETGYWDWNIESGDLYWSEYASPMFGFATEEVNTRQENFIELVHPDDRQKVIDALNDCLENSTAYSMEHRCVWPDGTIKWLLEKGNVVRNEKGEPLRMLGIVRNITDRKTVELEFVSKKSVLDLAQAGLSQFVTNNDILGNTAISSGSHRNYLQ